MYPNINKAGICFVLVTFLFSLPIQAMRGKDIEKEMYAGMKYEKIFDQRNVLSRCPDILKQEGHEKCNFTSEKKSITTIFKNIINVFFCDCWQKAKNMKTHKQLAHYNSIAHVSRDSEGLELNHRGDCAIQVDDIDDNSDVIIEIDEDNQEDKATEILDKALVEDYQIKKKWDMKQSLTEPAFSASINIGAALIGFFCVPGELGKGIGGTILVHTFKENIKDGLKAFYCIFISPLADPLERWELKYAKRKRFLPNALQETIEDKFGVARKSNQSLGLATNFARIALNLPLASKRLKPLIDSEEEVNKLLQGYNKKVVETIKLKFYNHYDRFSKKARPLYTPKTVLYLQGPPGVGKTHITEEIAELMGAYLIKLKVIKNAESIIGSEKTPGSLLEAICRPEVVRNSIILIDEIDHVVNNKGNSSLQLFLPLLEPDAKDFYSPYLRANIDVSHFCFVMCGNSPIENDALRSRFKIVGVENISTDTKKMIIYEMLPKKALENQPLMVEVDWLLKQDRHPGVREVRQTIHDEITRRKMNNHIKDQ